jgi:hypothetical protein
MSRLNPALAAVFFAVAAIVAAQEVQPAKPPEKRQDPEAIALIERFDGLLYAPRTSGLEDLEFTTKLPSGHHLVLKWKQPDKIQADLVVPADAPPEVARQLGLVIPKFQDEARKHASKFVDMEIGEVLREKHKDDDVILAGKNQVRIVARSEASKSVFKEQTLTFDERGLIKSTRVTAPTGVESTIEPTFMAWSGKHVYQSMKTRVATSQEDSTVTFEYSVVESIMLVKKVGLASKVGGKAREQVLEFFDFKVNRGIEDKAFDERADRPKPGGG